MHMYIIMNTALVLRRLFFGPTCCGIRVCLNNCDLVRVHAYIHINVCVFMCVYVYACSWFRICVYVCVNEWVCICEGVRKFRFFLTSSEIRICWIHIFFFLTLCLQQISKTMLISIDAHIYMYIHIYVHVCIYMSISMSISIYVYILIYIYIYM